MICDSLTQPYCLESWFCWCVKRIHFCSLCFVINRSSYFDHQFSKQE